jgi:group I intron endonuclease
VPYAEKIMGIYKIVNTVNGKAYVGQSQNIKKRIAEHFRLLRANKHSNQRLQHAFNKYGEEAFQAFTEVICEDVSDMDAIEEAFLSGEASFPEPVFYNIADFAKAPMRGKRHTDETRLRIKAALKKNPYNFQCPEHREKLSEGHFRGFLQDERRVKNVLFVLNNPHLTYAQRAEVVGSDASTVRKLYIKYLPLKERIEKEHPQWR